MSQKHCRGANWSRYGVKVHYKGKKKHWTVYYLDDEGRFKQKPINVLSALYWKARVQRLSTFVCEKCALKFKNTKQICPSCGSDDLK